LVDEDQKLIDFALQVLVRLEDETQYENVGTMRRAIAELDSKTRIVVERAQRHRLQADAFDIAHLDDSFTSMDPASVFRADTSGHESSTFGGDFGSANTTLDAELFGSWLEAQYFDVGVSYAESAPPAGKENPDFDGVVAEFLKQSWF
jgi:hypothetical protein